MLQPEVEHLVLRGPGERDLPQAADAVRAPAPAPFRLVLVEMTEAVELIDVRRQVAAIVGIPGEIEAIDLGGVITHDDGPSLLCERVAAQSSAPRRSRQARWREQSRPFCLPRKRPRPE